MTLARRAVWFVHEMQEHVTTAIERVDGGARFRVDDWERAGGGGGRTGMLTGGAVFEKAGVNVSEVWGELKPEFAATLPGDGLEFFATGLSVVVHPRSPMVPAMHANIRFLCHGSASWFGGGLDMTPCYPFIDDVIHFHRTLKEACDRHDAAYYPKFKQWCDDYFFLRHRNEARGVGGIFFDYLREDLDAAFAFWRDVGEAIVPCYLPIVERRTGLPYGDRERAFQLYRRGRYVEFNLLYDRGTLFGLKTDGRVESILMSLPPLVAWEYDFQAEPGSPEATLLEYLKPQDWLNLGLLV
jgi:coproporphyrinogen III oxidase